MTSYERSKRGFDVVAAGLGLVILSPLIVVVAAAVRIGLGSPVIFRQVRPGRGGAPFTLYKFRTMRPDGGGRLTEAERVTRLGALLRRTSVDELPELWNVLKGDMSLVGPRPLLMEYLPLYSAEQARRHDVRPGLTGWAQVNGRNAITWEKKFELDVWYVDHRNARLDAQILWRTLGRLAPGGVMSADGDASLPRFEGTVNERPS